MVKDYGKGYSRMKKIGQLLCCAMLICLLPMVISADSGYSTENDPLVTLSYIQQVLKAELKEDILDEITMDDITAEMKKQMKSELEASLKSSLSTSITSDLKKSLTDSLTTSLTKKLTEDLTTKLTASIKESVTKDIRDQVVKDLTASLKDQLSKSLEEQLLKELGETLSKEFAQTISAQITADITTKLNNELEAQFKQAFKDGLPDGYGEDPYEIIQLNEGQMLIANEPVELLMIGGLSEAVIPEAENDSYAIGMYDLTAGKRILNGQELIGNHYIVISRTDGCGVRVTNADATFMIRGEYSIVNQEQ